jgi:hypothetical protein
MRIYFSHQSDPMITDTVHQLKDTAERLKQFVDSMESRLFLQADTSGSPAPYEALLPGVEFTKGDGPILVSVAQKGLQVRGSPENLKLWCAHFAFPADASEGEHHHPEHVHRPGYIDPRTLSVIIEVQNAD